MGSARIHAVRMAQTSQDPGAEGAEVLVVSGAGSQHCKLQHFLHGFTIAASLQAIWVHGGVILTLGSHIHINGAATTDLMAPLLG